MFSSPPLWLILIAFVAMLGPLVFFHELGHYSVARLFRIPAETFSIGFGREVVGWTDRQGTRWKVGWLPLGGYVKFVGDMSPASDPADLETVPPELRDRIFQARPVWQRFLVVLAGPAANFLLAILIFAAFFMLLGAPQTNVVGAVEPNTPAARAGLVAGDTIVSIGGRETPTFNDLRTVVSLRAGEAVDVNFVRAGQNRTVNVTLQADTFRDQFGKPQKKGLLGIAPTTTVLAPLSPTAALSAAVDYTWRLVVSTIDGLGRILSGQISPKAIGGPISIAKVAGEGAALGPLAFVSLLAFLSINLGFINLLPVPMLDGGHLLFYGVEAVRRRPLSAEALEWSFRGGLAVLFALMVFTTLNDLGSLGLWDRLQRLIG
jgi:regulator of sigma E protease